LYIFQDEGDVEKNYASGGARKGKSIQYASLRAQSEQEDYSTVILNGVPTIGEIDGNLETEMKLEVQSEYSDHLQIMDEIDLDSTLDRIAADEMDGSEGGAGVEFSYNPIQRR